MRNRGLTHRGSIEIGANCFYDPDWQFCDTHWQVLFIRPNMLGEFSFPLQGRVNLRLSKYKPQSSHLTVCNDIQNCTKHFFFLMHFSKQFLCLYWEEQFCPGDSAQRKQKISTETPTASIWHMREKKVTILKSLDWHLETMSTNKQEKLTSQKTQKSLENLMQSNRISNSQAGITFYSHLEFVLYKNSSKLILNLLNWRRVVH